MINSKWIWYFSAIDIRDQITLTSPISIISIRWTNHHCVLMPIKESLFVIIVHREWGNNFARTADKQSDNFSVFVSAIAFRQLKYNFDWYLHLLVDQQLVSKYLTFQELNSWPTSDSNSGCLATTITDYLPQKWGLLILGRLQ